MGKADVSITMTMCFMNEFAIGGGKGSGNIQNYLLRDIQDRPYIPASTLKGRIRYHAQLLENFFPGTNCDYLFGAHGVTRGALYFDDATCQNFDNIPGAFLTQRRTGVTISRHTKSKMDKRLYTMETTGQSGEMVFEGAIQGYLRDHETNIPLLVAAIRLIRTLGGSQSRGLGWLAKPIQVTVTVDNQVCSLAKLNQWLQDEEVTQ